MESHNFDNWPLRFVRKKNKITLDELKESLKNKGIKRSTPYLSLLERGRVWPSREIVDSIVKMFSREITEMEILYPERYKKGPINHER